MSISRSEKSRKIERAIQKKYPKKELDIGISSYQQNKLREKIREKLDQEHAASAMTLAKEYLSKYSKDINVLTDLGQSYSWLYRYEEAISTFNNALKICHKDDRHFIYHWLATMYERKSDLDKAESYFKKSIQNCSEPTEALFETGKFYLRHGRQKESEKYLLDAINAPEGQDDEIYYNLGMTQISMGKYEEALESLDKAINLKPDNADAIKLIVDIKFANKIKIQKNHKYVEKEILKDIQDKTDEGNHISALTFAIGYLPLFQDNISILFNMTKSLIALYRLDEALLVLENSLKQCKNDLQHYIYYLLAEVYYKKGNLKQAEKFYIKASDKKEMYNALLGSFYGKCGHLDQSELCYTKTIKNPANSIEEQYYNLGFVQMATERYEEARLSFMKAIEISPDNDINYQNSLDDVNFVLQRLGKKNL